MNTKLTILISIVLTAASTAAGTYYLTTSVQPADTSMNAPETIVATQPNDDNPVQVEVNQDTDKPITIIVKAEATEKPHKSMNIGHIRDLKQPHYGVTQNPNPKTPLNQ